MKNFKDIKNRNDLAYFLEISLKKLTYILYVKRIESLYTSFEIPKKSGGVRHINAPCKELKNIQKKLATALYDYQKSIREDNNIKPNISHAFEKDKSILTNAKIHRNKRFVLNIDLEDFFGSFNFGRVRGFFNKNSNFNMPLEIATIIAQLTCYNGCLPQGAPTSPIITNLICQALDMNILKIAKKFKVDYTRYADDLTFSTNDRNFIANYPTFFEELTTVIERSGFNINHNKTRLLFKDSKQEVTGLVVNKKINVDRYYYKQTRAMANSLYSTGIFQIDGNDGTINQLEGRFSFINQVLKFNNKLEGKKRNLYELCSKEKEYQKFIFYKYFLANDKPLIVTEGKTDIVYLKSSLKKLYNEYPTLITKIDSKYNFNIAFLNRTKRLQYFLGVSLDGADDMQKIYNFYFGKNCLNLFKYFKEKYKLKPKNPVIFIFDNELNMPDKPLKKFSKNLNIKQIQEIKTKFYCNIADNLYLLTTPIPESEIEDLFDSETISLEINGKKFSKNNNFDNSMYYGKEIFSKYISDNYKKINFDGFKPLLNNLNEIIASYKVHSSYSNM